MNLSLHRIGRVLPKFKPMHMSSLFQFLCQRLFTNDLSGSQSKSSASVSLKNKNKEDSITKDAFIGRRKQQTLMSFLVTEQKRGLSDRKNTSHMIKYLKLKSHTYSALFPISAHERVLLSANFLVC